jgi:hypothetical protein
MGTARNGAQDMATTIIRNDASFSLVQWKQICVLLIEMCM